MTYENAVSLFRRGKLGQVIESLRSESLSPDFDPDRKVFLAYALAMVGETSFAGAMSTIAAHQLAPKVRSQLETARGIVSWRSGDSESAWRHLNLAVQSAAQSRDTERIAWAHLHLLRFAVDSKPLDALAVMLPRARRAVIDAGVPSLTAYLHACVSTMEGSRGNLDEALRHCDIAESLLEQDPNAWVLAAVLLNRGCVASFQCELTRAAQCFHKVIALANENGSARMRISAERNLGYLQFLTGEFGKAQTTLSRTLQSSANADAIIDSSDFLAKVYLAIGDLDRSDETLRRLHLYGDAVQYSEYATRWTAVTQAKLLLKRGDFNGALTWLAALEARSNALHDRPFNATVHLLTALALYRTGKRRECGRRLVRADFNSDGQNKDLQGQFHYIRGLSVRDDATHLALQLQQRAQRIWSSQRIVSLRSELEDDSVRMDERPPSIEAVSASEVARAVVNCVGAAFDLADQPALLGEELLNALALSGCSSNAIVIQVPDAPDQGFDRSGRRIIVRLGKANAAKQMALACDAPNSPSDAVLLTDIFRIGRAALALQKARQDERNRAALWPSDPIEEQSGALFVAEDMKTLLDTTRRVATSNIPVLITGETGTGKEVLARLIHSYSPRAAKTFLPFNCSATPREMLDAQLFGHRRGAFTGATENFSGVIRAAAGGTLFLDEIGESTLDIQPKLLRFLESGEVHPIGETHPQRVDVRVLAATNADVDALVAQGRFREDLFYRLNIVRLHIPPLRERRVEIPAFANHYLQKYAKESAKGELRLSEETMEYLVLYRWPGNVRQIANEMRRLAALAEPGAVLMPEHLSLDIAASRRTVPASDRKPDPSEIVVRIDQPLSAALQHVERAMVQAALAKTNGVDEAAKLLGLSRKGLYLKRLRFGMEIDRPKSEIDVA